MSFSAGNGLEIVSQFAADAFAEVCRLEKVEVNLIQLGESRCLRTLTGFGQSEASRVSTKLPLG